MGPRRAGAGQPPRTTLSRIALSALCAATRWGLPASKKLRRRYGSAEAAPTPARLPAWQIASPEIGPLAEREGWGWGAPSRDPYLLRRCSKAQTRISWPQREAAGRPRLSVVSGGRPPAPPGYWPVPR